MKKDRQYAQDLMRQWLNIVFAVGQILMGYIPMALHFGRNISESSAETQTAAIPAGYAFAIWGLIFSLCLLYGIYQVLPKNRTNELLRRVGPFTAGAFIFCTAWEAVSQFWTFGWPTLAIIILIAAFSLAALFKLTDYKKSLTGTEKWLVHASISILAGWISAATFANLSSVAMQLLPNYAAYDTELSISIIIWAAIFASAVIHRAKGNVLYVLTVIWALVAIAIANIVRQPNLSVAVVALGMVGFILLALVVSTLNNLPKDRWRALREAINI